MHHSPLLPIKAIIFDCDGTLIDNEGSYFFAWQKVVLDRNHFFSIDDYIQCMGSANPLTAQRLAAKMNAPSAEALLAECRANYRAHAKNGLKPIQHTVDFVLKLAAAKDRLGIKLAVASAGNKEEILRSLRQIGIDGLFDAIISGQDDLHDYNDPQGVNKPSPYIYWHTAKVLGVEPAACVVVEDSLPGLTAGVRAGCFTVAIPTPSTKIQDMSATDLKFKSLENLSVEQFFQLVQEKLLQKSAKQTPTVIFLNGTSSAGKTSIVQHLQAQLDQPFMHVGIDHFLFMLPSRYRMDGAESHLGYCFARQDDHEGAKISISKGSYGHKVNAAMRSSMQHLLTQGFNLIIDEVLFAEDDFHAYLELLQDYKVFFVAVKPPVDVAAEREKARGSRMLGLARGVYDDVYRNKTFDIEIDTSHLQPEEAAYQIVQHMQAHPLPQAFQHNIAAHLQRVNAGGAV